MPARRVASGRDAEQYWLMPGQPVRVVTVDDHDAFLRVAHDVVEATPGFEPVAEVSSISEAVRAVAELEPELVLIDVYMPEMNGVDLVRRIKLQHEDVVAVLISSHDYSEIPAEALSSGACAVLRKQELGPSTLQSLWKIHGPPPA
jgi:DNA-binding NarL/FixJ family response regulator